MARKRKKKAPHKRVIVHRACLGCGKIDAVRADMPSVMCRRCAGRLGGKARHLARGVRA